MNFTFSIHIVHDEKNPKFYDTLYMYKLGANVSLLNEEDKAKKTTLKEIISQTD